jgi:polar amino acid transport system permease protein
MREFTIADFLTMLTAVQWTATLVAVALVFGAPLALLLARMCTGRSRIARLAATGLLQLVQGVPVLGLLMFFYFGMPVFLGIKVPALVSVGAAFTIFTAAFLGEIWRGGIQAVHVAQAEAAACLGLTRWQIFRHVVAPQAFRIALPATVGFLVQLIKNTSLASVVGFVELARAGQLASAATFQPLASYACAAAIYFALCFPLTLWSRFLEEKLNGAR